MKKVSKNLPFPPLRFFIVLVCLLCLSSGIEMYGQSKTVTGTVVDDLGEPLPGANVTIKGTFQGMMTTVDGTYSLSVPNNAVLIFSFIGFKEQEIPVGENQIINVTMKEDMEMLDEVIVVGYGTQKKVNMTGAVAAVKIDDKMTSRSLSNVSTGLQGLVPGLQVTSTSGMAGNDNASLMIRGYGSVNGTSPLIVVDGMPDVDINRINFQDVESISILKDAASASIYGSRASNGVILITTRTGAGENKTTIRFDGSVAMERPTRMYDFMSDYPRALTLHQRAASTSTLRQNLRFKDGTIDQWMALSMIDPLGYPKTDVFDTFMRDGSLENYTISASGGSDKSNFYISVGVMEKAGVQINNDFTRYNARFNGDFKLINNLKTGIRFDGNWSEYTFSGSADGITDNSSSNSAGGDMQYAISGMVPYDPVSGRFGGAMAYGEDIQAYNPYANFNEGHMPRQQRQQMNGSMYLEWNVFKGFTARAEYALRYTDYFSKTAYIPTGYAYNFQTGADIGRMYVGDNAGVSDSQTTMYKTQTTFRVNYNTKIAGNHDINAMALYSEEYWNSRSTGASRNDRLHPSITEINGSLTNVQSNSGSSYTEGLRSYVGRFGYTGYDKYMLEFNFRVDGSSRFYKGAQYGFFPSISAGWRFTEESFIKSYMPEWFSSGKIRASWGELGSISGVGRTEQQELLSTRNYFSTEVIKGFVNTKMINQALSWEAASYTNIGLDLSFFRGKLMAEIDYYDRLTTDMIRPSEISSLLSAAYSAPNINIGTMRNRGIDLNFNWRDRIDKVGYSIGINGAYYKNNLEKWNQRLNRGTTYIDMPYGFLYTYEAIGMAQTWEDVYNNTPNGVSPGDIMVKDLNGDGLIDDKDRKAYPNLQTSRPTMTYGINLSVDYKGIEIVALFSGSAGRKDFWTNNYNKVGVPTERFAFRWYHWNEPWSLENRDTATPRFSANTQNSSSYWLYSMAYLRMKNVQIGYNIPKKIASKVSLSNARLYVSAENLFTITDYPGLDPEKTNNDRDLYPINKSFSAGVNITF